MVNLRNIRLLREALQSDGRPLPRQIRQRSDAQFVADVVPANVYDRLLFLGVRAEVWIEPGKPPSQGRIYREKTTGHHASGRVSLVLGAGNIASIAPTDVLHKLFVEDEVVVLKMNPVNEYLGPLIERAFGPLVDDGFLAVLYGGPEIGSRLCHDSRVETIHLTGSDLTHDAIVWGADSAEQTRRKTDGDPLLSKPVTSELGCVTPVLVVPGPWKKSDLDFQARHVAAMVAHNASFNCNAAKVLVTARGWRLRNEFLERVEHHLAATPARDAYYPGAQKRYAEILSHYPDAHPLGNADPDGVPWTILPDVPPDKGQYALTQEAFCGVLATTDIDATDAQEFLDRAVQFVNESVWGTLSCVVLIDPHTARSQAKQLDRAVAELRYGGIGINVWAGVNFALGTTSWGAFPGHSLDDIGSGRGTVHNTLLFDFPQKSVVRGAVPSVPEAVPVRRSPEPQSARSEAGGVRSRAVAGEDSRNLHDSPPRLTYDLPTRPVLHALVGSQQIGHGIEQPAWQDTLQQRCDFHDPGCQYEAPVVLDRIHCQTGKLFWRDKFRGFWRLRAFKQSGRNIARADRGHGDMPVIHHYKLESD